VLDRPLLSALDMKAASSTWSMFDLDPPVAALEPVGRDTLALAPAHADPNDARLEAMLDELRARVSWLEAENARLREVSHHDELTGLKNRRGFLHDLERSIDALARYGGRGAVLLIDLDGMKRLNDTCGHPVGDEALRTVACVLRANLRGADVPARFGGDEFGVVLPNTTVEGASKVAERLRIAIGNLALPRGLKLTASIGVAEVVLGADREQTVRSVIERADALLYAAKRAGGDGVWREARAA
jgi:diguanylate cyclase (GGDEF)-like protein